MTLCKHCESPKAKIQETMREPLSLNTEYKLYKLKCKDCGQTFFLCHGPLTKIENA